MNDNEKPALGLGDAEDIDQVKQYKLERRLKRTDLTVKERMETEEELGLIRIQLTYIRGERKRLVQQLLHKL